MTGKKKSVKRPARQWAEKKSLGKIEVREMPENPFHEHKLSAEVIPPADFSIAIEERLAQYERDGLPAPKIEVTMEENGRLHVTSGPPAPTLNDFKILSGVLEACFVGDVHTGRMAFFGAVAFCRMPLISLYGFCNDVRGELARLGVELKKPPVLGPVMGVEGPCMWAVYDPTTANWPCTVFFAAMSDKALEAIAKENHR